ncbi:MAG: hypothetical protein GXO82_06415 [Chlorobi bacterium]|nr:hypothetical protein [Chlorobiota bacterium]
MKIPEKKRALLLAGISVFVYIGITAVYDLREGFWAFAALYTTLFLVLGLAYFFIDWNDRLIRTAFISAIAFRVAVMPLPPTLSDDAYRYLWDGKMLQHGQSLRIHSRLHNRSRPRRRSTASAAEIRGYIYELSAARTGVLCSLCCVGAG